MKTVLFSHCTHSLLAWLFGVLPNNANLNPRDPRRCYLPGEAIPDNCYQPS